MSKLTSSETLSYRRYQALGNDYIVMGPEYAELLTSAAAIRRLCDRHIGLGSDGILLAAPAPAGGEADVAVRILNPDGSEAEKSGNGVRIFAKFCFDHGGYATDRPLRIQTLGGLVGASLVARRGNGSTLSVAMGRASFRCEDLPMAATGEWIRKELRVGDRELAVTCVSMGNPHAVVFVAPEGALDEREVRAYGPLLERHEMFPRSTNVQFARVLDRHTVEAMIWERGAGWTLSSGSSSCAVAAAAVRLGLTERSVQVKMPGGDLKMVIDEQWNVQQVGTAQELMRGEISAELLADVRG